MKITCPVCKGLGWSDKSLADVGTKPRCDPCGGIGMINIDGLLKDNKAMRAKIDRVYALVMEVKTICTANIWMPESAMDALKDAVVELGNVY